LFELRFGQNAGAIRIIMAREERESAKKKAPAAIQRRLTRIEKGGIEEGGIEKAGSGKRGAG
jgi:hypothetical protein